LDSGYIGPNDIFAADDAVARVGSVRSIGSTYDAVTGEFIEKQQARMAMEKWVYEPGNSDKLELRKQPEIYGNRTGHFLEPNEEFEVVETREVGDIVFLKVAEGKGWTFDHMPGKGQLCHVMHEVLMSKEMSERKAAKPVSQPVPCKTPIAHTPAGHTPRGSDPDPDAEGDLDFAIDAFVGAESLGDLDGLRNAWAHEEGHEAPILNPDDMGGFQEQSESGLQTPVGLPAHPSPWGAMDQKASPRDDGAGVDDDVNDDVLDGAIMLFAQQEDLM
jgi:hypothetical protein